MIPVHEEPLAIQREFGRVQELCEFCRLPTRFWDVTKSHPVCQACANKNATEDLHKGNQ